MSVEIRKMHMSDLADVLEIITSHDDDDGEAAEEELYDLGVDNHWVLSDQESAVGVSGFREIENCDATYYLSWTYLDERYIGKGLGKKLLTGVIDKLKEINARKLFVKVSNYVDEDGVSIYESAMHLYKSVGFELEITSNDFYDEGEDQLILGLDLKRAEDQEQFQVIDEKPVIRFKGLFEIAETEGAYTFEWSVEKKQGLFSKRSFSEEDLIIGLKAVKKQGGRKVFLTFPSNLVLIHTPLRNVGFKFIGELKSYYEEGLHEMHFSHDLTSLD